MMAGGSLLPINGAGTPPAENWKIEYIREKIPEFDISPYRGARYEDRVPDTLDIAERAKLGINCLTGITDPKADCEIFVAVDFFRNPPVMGHEFGDWCQNVEGMIESLPLLRIASGSDLNSNVDRVWMEGLLKSVGPDGLVYYPLNGTPWARLNCVWLSPVWKADGSSTNALDKSVTQITNPGLWPRAIAAMSIYYLRDKNPMWKQTIERMVQGMSALASDEGDYAFFPAGGYEPNRKFSGSWGAAELVMPIGYLALDGGNSRAIQGLAQYYRLTGYEPARVLAEKLVKFIRFRSDAFDGEGRFRFSSYERSGAEVLAKYSREHGGQVTAEEIRGQRLGGHFHGHAIGILPMTEYGVTVGDRELLEWCKSSFEWARDESSSLVGFFPELIVPGYPSCESCAVADMIGIAAKLTQAGVGDYWDDLDRWTRNQFAENQLTEGEWVYRLAESMPKKPVAYNETADHVVERNLGGFSAFASANEWVLHDGPGGCCSGNSTRALYYIWENIVEAKGEKFQVNLLLNRASAWADVYSFIPYQGRVNIKMKRSCQSVRVRAPEWVESGSPQMVCKVNGSSRELAWEGRYVNAGAAKAGETIELGFPIATRTVKETIGAARYSLEMRGNTVVSVDPPGKNGALYERKQYRSDQVSWRKAQRFVPDDQISW
jgi:hypothetical protein